MMFATHAWLLALLTGVLALAGLAFWALAQSRAKARPADMRRRFAEAFGIQFARAQPETGSNWLETLGNRLLAQRKRADSDEVKMLLARAGWKRKTDLAIFYAIRTLLPVLAGLISSYPFFVNGIDQRDWAIVFLAGGAGWLLPKRILVHLAAARQSRIADQVPVLVHLLRVLLGTGLSVEQGLRSLVADTREMLPDLARELDQLLRRIDTGEDIASAMRGMAQRIDVPALTDLAQILEQTWRMGGNVLKSLGELSNLIEDRMKTDLKEKVSKLSAKMTIVMMLFLFPALLVFLAAPGFLAIARGMKNALG